MSNCTALYRARFAARTCALCFSGSVLVTMVPSFVLRREGYWCRSEGVAAWPLSCTASVLLCVFKCTAAGADVYADSRVPPNTWGETTHPRESMVQMSQHTPCDQARCR